MNSNPMDSMLKLVNMERSEKMERGWEDMTYYDPQYCDGHECCRDCGRCYIAELIGEDKVNEELGRNRD